MSNYTWKLDDRPGRRKDTCPSCHQKTLVRYINSETGDIHPDAGRCDRENSCTHWVKPAAQIINQSYSTPSVIEVKFLAPDTAKVLKIQNDTTSSFHDSIIKIGKKSKAETLEHLKKWGVGTHEDKTAFIYKNEKGEAENIKYVKFEGFNRSKSIPPYYEKFTSEGKYIKHFFGRHLVTDKIICLVESEKDAILSSLIYPQFEWLATGGNNGISEDKYAFLLGKTVYYICQGDAAGRENSAIKRLRSWNIEHSVIDLFPERTDGYDISDAIQEGIVPEIKPSEEPVLSEEEKAILAKVKPFDFSKPVPKPDDIISIDGNTISTPGNLTVLAGPSKGGKSGLMIGLIAGAIQTTQSDIDIEPIRVKPNSNLKAIIHLDTEQSDYNHYRGMSAVMRRASMTQQPEYFYSWSLRGLSKLEKLKATSLQIKLCAKKHNGIHIIFFDGGADFVNDLNDAKEANEAVEYLESLAITYNCPVINVLHLNPNSPDKTRGHYGSQLERKCESQLRITKDKETDISTIEGVLLRNAGGVPQVDFRYDNDKGYHVTCGYGKSTRVNNQIKELRGAYAEILQNGLKVISYKDLTDLIKDHEMVSIPTAKRRIKSMLDLGIIIHIDTNDTKKGFRYKNDA
jgi:hypothetical protein